MLPILGDLIPYAVPVALSPLPIIAAVMLLLAPSGPSGALGFVAGRFGALLGLSFVVALLAAEVAGPWGGAERGGWLRIGVGCLLLVGAGVVLRRRIRNGATPAPSGWMQSIGDATPGRAARLGVALTALNLKEVAFAAGAGLIVGGAAVPPAQALLASLVFAGLACLGVIAPTAWRLADPEGSRAGLGAAQAWLARNKALLAAAVLVAIGVNLIGSGLEAL